MKNKFLVLLVITAVSLGFLGVLPSNTSSQEMPTSSSDENLKTDIVSNLNYNFNRNLTIGSSGADVAALQTILVLEGYLTMPAGVTKGYFGSLTKGALVTMQSKVGIPPTGYFGPITRAHMLSYRSEYLRMGEGLPSENTYGLPTTIQGAKKIVPASDGSIYIGFTENSSGDISNFEQAVGKKVALTQLWPNPIKGSESAGNLAFDAKVAELAWKNGYTTMIYAYEGSFFPGFTVDKLIKGEFDADLKKFADEMKKFGKPMFFTTAREPNASLVGRLGGFGVNGDMDRAWASQNNQLNNSFNPGSYNKDHLNNKNLFNDLGSSQVCDGLERLGAAQRYYYDFFVDREGIDFLTFDTMGWVATNEPSDGSPQYGSCNSFETLYSTIKDYSDWVSINWYLWPDGGEEQKIGSEPLDITEYEKSLSYMMGIVRKVAPSKPVLITELGFCLGNKDNKAIFGLETLVNKYPEIKAFMHWGEEQAPGSPFKCGITSSDGAQGFKQVFSQYPTKFSSCVQFGDGTIIPNCSSTPTSGVLTGVEASSNISNIPPQQSLNQCIEACVVSQGLTERQCKPICEQGN